MSTELMTSSHETQVTAKRIPRQYTVQNETSIFDRLYKRKHVRHLPTSAHMLSTKGRAPLFICSFPFPTSSSDVLSFLSMNVFYPDLEHSRHTRVECADRHGVLKESGMGTSSTYLTYISVSFWSLWKCARRMP